MTEETSIRMTADDMAALLRHYLFLRETVIAMAREATTDHDGTALGMRRRVMRVSTLMRLAAEHPTAAEDARSAVAAVEHLWPGLGSAMDTAGIIAHMQAVIADAIEQADDLAIVVHANERAPKERMPS